MRSCLLITMTIPHDLREQISLGKHPRVEYFELADKLCAEIFDFRSVHASGMLLVKIARGFGNPIGLAALALVRRKEFDVFYAGAESTGLVLAALFKFVRRRPKIAILNHYLSGNKKAFLFRLFGLRRTFDSLICLNEFQTRFAKETLHIAPDRVSSVHYGANVDGAFFDPSRSKTTPGGYILSVGRERRDYDTLLTALQGIDLRSTIVASGIRDSGEYNNLSSTVAAVPVTVRLLRHVSYVELRDLYAGCLFTVLPVHDVEYPAGVTAIIEAMAMGKTVIATRSRGIREYVEDGVTGLWARNGDANDLRERILYLWNNPDVAQRMGAEARKRVAARIDLSGYIKNLASMLSSLANR
jgi:glycosyltransferase involved in cell wall biosynthesis